MSSNPPHVVILGGGSAGWITASLLHHEWGEKGGEVTLVESPEIGIIGVGEGSTPQLKSFFDHIGIAEHEWMERCDATYKLGIRFTGWSEREGFASYFHPFPGPVDLHTQDAFFHNCALARRGFDVEAHPDSFFLAAGLAEAGMQPHPARNFPFAPSYGYHFDAHKLGGYLRDWGTSRGISHRQAKVVATEQSQDGTITALRCDDGTLIEGDFFVDCSGFRSVIAQEALGVRFNSYAGALFNDRAVVLPSEAAREFRPRTESVAMRAGWRWSIPLRSRTGNGYVYSSRFISDDDAEAELRAALGMEECDEPARLLRMKVGRLERSWEQNCLAVGLSQGFIEPLEATALHIVIATVLEFARAFEAGGFEPGNRDKFNTAIGARYDAIRDYIVAHYRMNQRHDSDYWRENASNQALSDGLKAMMTSWFTHQDLASANKQSYPIEAYSNASWHCLFAGYGAFPPTEKTVPLPDSLRPADMESIADLIGRCSANFTR